MKHQVKPFKPYGNRVKPLQPKRSKKQKHDNALKVAAVNNNHRNKLYGNN